MKEYNLSTADFPYPFPFDLCVSRKHLSTEATYGLSQIKKAFWNLKRVLSSTECKCCRIIQQQEIKGAEEKIHVAEPRLC